MLVCAEGFQLLFFTVDELVGPRWSDIFGSPPAAPYAAAAKPGDSEGAGLSEAQRRGREGYRKWCAGCHGQRDPANLDVWQWKSFPDFAKIVPAIDPFQFPKQQWLKDWMEFSDRSTWRRQATDPERQPRATPRIVRPRLQQVRREKRRPDRLRNQVRARPSQVAAGGVPRLAIRHGGRR